MNHRKPKDQRASIDWARKVLKNKHKYVILDTETTGLTDNDEIIQLAITDLNGDSLVSELIKPAKKKSINKKALEVHGIKMSMLKDAPTFNEIAKPLKKALKGKIVIAYNSDFDARMYSQSHKFGGGYKPWGMPKKWQCAMLQYSRFFGEWNEYQNNYKWQKLTGGDHSALGDCLATLEVIKTMATTQKNKKWYEFWVSKDSVPDYA